MTDAFRPLPKLFWLSALGLCACATTPAAPEDGTGRPANIDANSGVASAAMPAPSYSPAPTPLGAACAAFRELRRHEVERPAETPGPLRVDAVREHFRRADAFGFSGGVRLLLGGEVQLSRTFGYADHVRRIAMAEDAVFNIGSVSKQFTAAAILRLEELGRLRTADTLGTHLPGVPPDKAGINIHHLLTHQSGLPHTAGVLSSMPARDEAVRVLLGTPLTFSPGTRYSYSNSGYALLAAIVDRLAPNGFEAFLRDELWLPLGMTRTGMVLPDWSNAQIADGLEFIGALPVQVPEEWDPASGTGWFTRGAGGMSSTLADLTRWAEALRTGAILSDRSRRKLFWPHVRMNVRRPLYYSYGWSIGAASDGSCAVNHNGGAGIHYDVLTIWPDQGAVVAAFNTQQRSPWRVSDNFVETVNPVLTGAPSILPDVAVGGGDVSAHAGTYRLPSGESLRLVARSGRLMVPADNALALRLFSPWPLADAASTAALGDRSALAAELMNGIAAGNYAAILSRLPPNVPAEAEADFWRRYWPRLTARTGAYRGAEIVATVRANEGLRTLVLVRFERASSVFGLAHSAGGRVTVETLAWSFFPEIHLAPAEGGVFQAFYPDTGRRIPVRFDGNGVMAVGEEPATLLRPAS